MIAIFWVNERPNKKKLWNTAYFNFILAALPASLHETTIKRAANTICAYYLVGFKP